MNKQLNELRKEVGLLNKQIKEVDTFNILENDLWQQRFIDNQMWAKIYGSKNKLKNHVINLKEELGNMKIIYSNLMDYLKYYELFNLNSVYFNKRYFHTIDCEIYEKLSKQIMNKVLNDKLPEKNIKTKVNKI